MIKVNGIKIENLKFSKQLFPNTNLKSFLVETIMNPIISKNVVIDLCYYFSNKDLVNILSLNLSSFFVNEIYNFGLKSEDFSNTIYFYPMEVIDAILLHIPIILPKMRVNTWLFNKYPSFCINCIIDNSLKKNVYRTIKISNNEFLISTTENYGKINNCIVDYPGFFSYP